MTKSRFLIIAALIATQASKAQEVRKYSNEFLNIGVSARGFGMAGSLVASTNDATSGYWNPAGLASLENNIELSLMHANYFTGIANYDYAAFAAKTKGSGVIGASFIRFGIDGIANTFDLIRNGQINYDRITTFSAVDYAFLVSYAMPLKVKGLNVGGNAKVVHRKVGPFAKAWGFGLDAGVTYRKNENWMFGATARDITSTFNAWSFSFTEDQKAVLDQTGNDIPSSSVEVTLPRLILAGAYKFHFDKKKHFSLLSELDADMTFDGKRNTLVKSNFASIDPHVGIEAGYRNIVFIRSGIGNIQKQTDIDGKESTTLQPSIGVGLMLGSIYIDYALSNVGANLYSNVFSVKLAVNKKNSQQ